MDSSHPTRVVVVVGPDDAAVGTVTYALRESRDLAAESGTPVALDVRVLTGPERGTLDSGLRARLEGALAVETSTAVGTSVETVHLTDRDPGAGTEALLDAVGEGLARLVVTDGLDLSVQRLRTRLGVGTVEYAPTGVTHERHRLVRPRGPRRLAAVFGLTYAFYLALGGFAGGLDLLTGALSAGVVALTLSHVALAAEPEPRRSGGRILRMAVFVPVLLWEVLKANVVIAALILHPALPIDPATEDLETDTREGLERMVLANSISLTPGTLAIDVQERTVTVHSLTPGTLRGVEEGRIQRLVAWVFHGSGGEGPQSDGGGDRR